ncbi:MAG TPA: hypothetical protein VHV83_10425 [Armatimonadota bacterium]|nr:hypothetical protein [Armatimonadota bacterium]
MIKNLAQMIGVCMASGSLMLGLTAQAQPAPTLQQVTLDPNTLAATQHVTPTFEQLKKDIPRVNVPLYLMEYHIWFSSPFGAGSRGGWTHWVGNGQNIERPIGAGWQRDNGSVGYPMLGFYDSAQQEVIRWQLRCMHAAGIDGVFVQLFPMHDDGTHFGEEDAIFKNVLDIAAEEGVKIGIHDEVNFRQGWTAQKPEVMAARAAQIISRFGDHPAFLKINGKPAYAFQVWSLWNRTITYDDLARIFHDANAKTPHGIYWIPMISPNDKMLAIPDVSAIVVCANSNFIGANSKKPFVNGIIDWEGLDQRQVGPSRRFKDGMKAANKAYWLWGYAGFNDCSYANRAAWFDRRGGRSLIEVLKYYLNEKPDAIMLSSWNDWVENTAMEPGWAFDDFNGDPYLYCRILAACKGKEFTPPPLPKPEAVDPWMHATLYGIDHTPPVVDQVRYSPLEPALQVTAFDANGKVAGVRALRYGNGMVRFSDKAELLNAALVRLTDATIATAQDTAGLVLKSGGDVNVDFTTPPSTPELAQNAWLHLYYYDGQAGSISVNYPANPAVVRTFEPRPLVGYARCQGNGQWREAWIKLRNLTPATQHCLVTLRYGADKSSERKESVLLGSACLVYDFSHGISGLARSARPVGNVGDFQINNVIPDTSTSDWIFVQASDDSGNVSVPQSINLGSLTDKFHIQRIK